MLVVRDEVTEPVPVGLELRVPETEVVGVAELVRVSVCEYEPVCVTVLEAVGVTLDVIVFDGVFVDDTEYTGDTDAVLLPVTVPDCVGVCVTV